MGVLCEPRPTNLGFTVKFLIFKLTMMSCVFGLVVGCSADGVDAENSQATGTTDEATQNGDASNPSASTPAADWNPEVIERADGWLEVRPGGETTCARGTDYAYFVRPGDPEKSLSNFKVEEPVGMT